MLNKPIGHALHALDATLRRYVETYSHKKAHAQLTGANTWVLLYIAENGSAPVYLRDIERRFGITRSTASKVVDTLVRRGFVERHTVEIDARLRRLTLTEKAQALIQSIERDREMIEETLLQGFTENERTTVLIYLERMRQNLEISAEKKKREEASPHD